MVIYYKKNLQVADNKGAFLAILYLGESYKRLKRLASCLR